MGATMISISVNHPDVEEFIDCKTDLNKVTGANISVRVSDAFMKAVENDEDYILRWPCTEKTDVKLEEYNKLYETPFGYAKKVKAKELFNKLVKNNWDYAEPGILYWDRISNWNIVSEDPDFEYAGTNPCAEEPLPAGGSCLLGSINLSAFVVEKTFDYNAYKQAIRISVRALNKVLADGLTLHPLKIQRDTVSNWRQIGLGVMGIADMLIKMGIKYDSEAGLTMCKSIANMLASEALDESANLAQSMEGAYPKFNLDAVLASDYVKKHAYPETIDKIKKYGLYNSQLLTIAPTGTLSTMLQISGGIEPIFAMSYTRTTKSLHGKDKDYKVYTKIAQDWLDANPNSELPEYFVESGTIDSNFRIKMQGVWQESIDASISSTVNLPETATIEDVYNIYMGAWKAGLKGITIFRANCKRVAILNVTPKDDDTKEENPTELKRGEIIRAGDDCIGLKRTLMTGCGTLHCTAYFDPSNGDLRETYLSKGSQGGCNNFMIGLSRMISLAARGGIKLESIVDQLKSSGTCPSYAVRRATKHDTSIGSSCPVAVGNALVDMHKEILERIKSCAHEYIKPITIESIKIDDEKYSECPECHNKSLIHDGGCVQCVSCGYSKCS